MNFHGNNAISPATRTTGRTLLLLSTTLIFALMGWIDTAETSIVGLKIESDAFIPILQFLVVAALVSHLVQWNSDRVAFKGWNLDGAKPGAPRWGASSKSRLYDVIEKLNDLDPKDSEQLVKLEEELRKFNNSFASFERYAFFYVWVWYGAMPALVGIAAVLAGFYA